MASIKEQTLAYICSKEYNITDVSDTLTIHNFEDLEDEFANEPGTVFYVDNVTEFFRTFVSALAMTGIDIILFNKRNFLALGFGDMDKNIAEIDKFLAGDTKCFVCEGTQKVLESCAECSCQMCEDCCEEIYVQNQILKCPNCPYIYESYMLKLVMKRLDNMIL